MRHKFLWITLLLAVISIHSQAQIYSFEDNLVPSGWVSSGTTPLSTSGLKYKLGTKSLQWDWDAGSKFTLDNPAGLSSAALSSNGGIYLWLYNTAASSSKLVFKFYNSTNTEKCTLDVNLNFQGWRCILAGFKGDMRHDLKNISKMVIQAPSAGNGTLYFDHIEFQTTVRWDRMSDAQYLVTQSAAVFDFWGIRANGEFTSVPTAGTAQTTAVNTIATRLENWYLGTGRYAAAPEFISRKSAVTSKINYTNSNLVDFVTTGDKTAVTGVGLYPENISTVNGTSVRNFSDVSSGSMLWLAHDYRLNNREISKTRWLNLIDWFYDQGWADGSAMGGLMFEKIRSSGYFHSLFLMRNQLGSTRLNRELSALNWFGLWGNVNMPFDHPGENADQIRTMCIAKLAYALMQPDANKQAAALSSLTGYFNNAFSAAPGYLETFKPDFSGYHHAGTYFTQYYPDALYAACWTAYMLRDTPYALSDSVYSVLKNCLLTYRLTASFYSAPVATCGRFPTGTEYLDEILPAFAYLALAKNTPDTDLLAAFGRLWKPTVSPLKETIARASTDIIFRTSLGETEACLDAVAAGVAAESSPKAAFYLPYSGLMVNRGTNRHVSVKGFSKYIWDFESGTPSDNLYGRYLSYGQLEYTDLITLRKSNNYESADWDWSRIPGTTTKYLAKADMKYTSGSPYRNFSDQSFLGGLSLNDSVSVFSMQLHDNTFDKSFYANKSVFCFGNVLVCLGSDIRNGDNANKTETTLFQQELKTGESIKVNGSVVTAGQTDIVSPVLSDNFGNRFIVKSGLVDVVRTNQMYAAVIDHGTNPTNGNYLYYMLLKGSDIQENTFKNELSCPLKVKQQDANAHIVTDTINKVWAYAVFNSSLALDLTKSKWIKQVNTPSILMFNEQPANACKLVLTIPDMRRATAINSDKLDDNLEKTPGSPFNYEVVLDGVYSTTNPDVTVTVIGETTKLAITVVDGKSYTINLTKISGPLPVTLTSFKGKKEPGSVRLEWNTSGESNINLFTVEKSFDKLTFATVGSLQAKNLASGGSYQLQDRAPLTVTTYYRLKTTDFDGKIDYSQVIAVSSDEKLIEKLYPNPASSQITLEFAKAQKNISVKVYTVDGKPVLSKVVSDVGKAIQIDISELVQGNYILRAYNDHQITQFKFVKK